jgi:hypothetical protein
MQQCSCLILHKAVILNYLICFLFPLQTTSPGIWVLITVNSYYSALCCALMQFSVMTNAPTKKHTALNRHMKAHDMPTDDEFTQN